MGKKLLISELSLAYSPLSNYDFEVLKHESIIQQILSNSRLYIIAQRPVLSFENVQMHNGREPALSFEIHQHGNPNLLSCKLPLFQENIATNRNKEVKIFFGSHDPNSLKEHSLRKNIHRIRFYEGNDRFLVFFSPEKFLDNYWNGYLDAEIIGDFRDFTTYNVHYVGESTKQDIWKRLTGHSTLQEILGKEYPITYGNLPTHEIVVLFFKFRENNVIESFGPNSTVNDFEKAYRGENLPNQSTIYLDAEKALIHAMQPRYNKIIYKDYPKSTDGLYSFNFDTLLYMLMDPITLKYDGGAICGSFDYFGGDFISVEKGNKLIIHKKGVT